MSNVRVNEGSEIHGFTTPCGRIDGWGKGIIVTGEKYKCFRVSFYNVLSAEMMEDIEIYFYFAFIVWVSRSTKLVLGP
ncbi:hypothetical protein CEXT_340681 [Caerostris extrusa]|uniref:Uncharacterized protein n=1 Tax=Caerostris extrusa TaxID=172846 RepID=A0AAV4TGR7_CAEEX|nr:hypothetical protein CEXT_340681 [Caerostris extrusa]